MILLLKRGADATLLNNEGKTAEQCAFAIHHEARRAFRYKKTSQRNDNQSSSTFFTGFRRFLKEDQGKQTEEKSGCVLS